MRKIETVVLALVIFFSGSVSSQAQRTPEEKCQFRRAREWVKYEKCVENWRARSVSGDRQQKKLSRCRTKYHQKWRRLHGLVGTSCAAPRFVDSGASVKDNLTGLVWEKKTLGNVSDRFFWTNDADGDLANGDGTVFSDFLLALNSSQYDGVYSWRLPSFAELQTILLPEEFACSVSPCIDPIFGPTAPLLYWTSTYDVKLPNPFSAWGVSFKDGSVTGILTWANDGHVRAVRGGL